MTRNPPRDQAMQGHRQGRRLLASKRAKPSIRHRRLLCEWLENRHLLAALARFDFDDVDGETGPGGWTRLLDRTEAMSALDPSGIGINFPAATQGTPTTFIPATVPSDLTGIRNGFLKSGSLEVQMEFLLTNLNSQKSYEVWVLGGNNTGSSQTQQIRVEGNAGTTTFDQSIGSSQLWVNQSVGDVSKQLTEFAPIFVSSPLHVDLNNDEIPDNHVVRVTVVKPTASLAAQVAGVAIREFDPTSFTLPPAGGPFTLLVEGGNRVVKNSSGTLLRTLPSIGAITINGTAAASDILNVDLSSGNPLAGGVAFHGGPGASDKLTITGGSQGVVTYNYTNANDGSVAMSNFGTVSYTGLEPITNSGTATDVIFNLPATSDVAFLDDNGNTPADGMLRLRSTPAAFELTDFAVPTSSLTVNLGGGGDSFTVSAAPLFTAALTINGGAGDDTIFLNSTITFASGKNLNVDLQDDDPTPGIDTINVGTGVGLLLSGSGAATLKASKNIALAAGSSIVTAGGPISLAANQQLTPTPGNFVGLDILGGTVKSTSGDITLSGRGGNGLDAQVGIYIHESALIGDTTTGSVTINGRGGDTPSGSLNGENVGLFVESASAVKSGGGNIALNGTGGSDADLKGLHDGVVVDQSTINALGAGTLMVTGAGAGPGSHGIRVALGDALKTASGKMTLTGTGEVGVFINQAVITASADIEITGTHLISSEAGIRQAGNLNTFDSGNIKLIADILHVQSTVDAQSRAVTIVPKTPGRAIKFDVTNDPAALSLTNLDQSLITAGTLNIGDANSGPITFTADITRPTATTVNLTSGGAIRFATGMLDTAGGNAVLIPGSSAAASFAKTGADLIVGSSAVAFASGADAAFVLNNTTAETGYEVLTVTGNINLTGADLVVSGSHMPTAGNTFAIVKYTGVRTGTFNNSSVTLNGQLLNVVYDDANQQVLLEVAAGPTLSATLAGDSLTIDDADAVGKNNNLTVSSSSGNLVISDANERFISAPPGGTLSNGDKTLTIPLATITGALTINTEGGNDTLTVDFAGGNVTTNTIIYNGGTQSGSPGDNLKLVGGTFATVTHNFTGATTGTIFLDSNTVSYSGLEPVDMSGTTATNLVFNLPSAASNAVLEDDGTSSNSISKIRSANSTFESTTFSNPTGSLTINRGNPADTLTLNALPDFTADLSIGSAAAPLNNVTFTRALTLAPDKSLSVQATGTINLGSQADIQASGTGSVSLTTTRNISLSGSSITTVDGNLTLSANQQLQPTTGDFAGIDLNNAVVQVTGRGNLALFGRGGVDMFDLDNHGIHLRSNSVVRSTSADVGAGTIALQGTGGDGAQSGAGVAIFGTGVVSSVTGDITITALAANSAAATNFGIFLGTDGTISSTGSAKITLNGTGGPGHFNNDGITIAGIVTSAIGDIMLTGQGGTGENDSNEGISITGTVESTASAKISMNGIGGSGSFDNNGVTIEGEVRSVTGEINIAGTGGVGTSFQMGVTIDGASAKIASTDGNISISGTGGTGIGRYAAVHVGNAQILSSGSASISITGVGGSGNNAQVSLGGTSVLTSSGAVRITGTPSDNICSIDASGTIDTSAAGAAIEFITDCITIGSQPINAGAGAVTLRPKTAGRPIELGGIKSFDPLVLTDAELDRITAGKIVIGDLNSGPVTFSAPISLANSDTLEVITGSTINDTGAATIFTDTSLALNAATGIGTTSPLNIAVSNLAAAGGTGGVNISNTGDLIITTVGGVIGTTATDSSIEISAAGSITVDQPITATVGGGIELTASSGGITVNAPLTAGIGGVTLKADTGIQLATAAADITSSGPIDINADFDANATGAFSSVTNAQIDQTGIDVPVTITASDIDLAGTIDSSGILILQPSTASRIIAIHDNAGDFHLDVDELTRAAANNGGLYTIGRIGGTGDIRLGGNGSVQLPNGDFSFHGGNVTFNGPLLLPLTAPTLEIISSGEIQQAFAGNAITNATSLLLDSALGVGALVNPLRVANGQAVAARATSSGPVAIASTDSLTSRTVGGVSGISTNGGPIQLEAFEFRVGLTGVGLGPINAGAGSVTITATGNSFGSTGGLIINDAVTAGSPSTFNANALFLNATGSVNVGASTLVIQPSDLDHQIDLGGNDISGTTLGITNAELDRIVAGTLRIGQSFRGQITISEPVNLANNPTPIPTLRLFSKGGIIDANVAGNDLTVTNLAITAANGPDSSPTLSTQVNNLSASYNSVGDFKISNAGPLTITLVNGLGGVSSLGGDVEITAAGPLTVLATISSTSGDIFLTAAGDDQLLRINSIVSSQGNGTFTADKMAIDGVVNFSLGRLTIVPESIADAGDAIDLGSATDTAANTLALSPAELSNIGDNIQIGDATAGQINITASHDRSFLSNFLLESSGAINFTTGSLDTAGGSLILSPGADTGVGVAKSGTDVNLIDTFDVGTLSFASGADLNIPINGDIVNTQYHQLNVAGIVDLTGVNLALSGTFTPAAGTQFFILFNDGTEEIIGTFDGLPEGAVFTSAAPNATFQINYHGGTGNDVVLTAVDPSDPSFHGTSDDDEFLVRRAAADVEILLNGIVTLVTPFASISRIRLDGLAGNDTLTVELTGGDPIPSGGINFSGGVPTTGPGDQLIIAGGAQGTVTYNYTNAHDGSIVMSNFGAITYTGLEPILNTGSAADIIINLPPTANTITLGDDGAPGNGRSRLSGATIETTDFTNPTNSLTINRGNAGDSLTVNSLPDFSAGLTIGSAAAPLSTVTFAGSLTLAPDKNLSVHAMGTISLQGAQASLQTSGTGSISLTTERNIDVGGSITTVDGNLTLSANQQATPTSGNFIGINVTGVTIQVTGTGSVNLSGRGGNDSSTTLHHGIQMQLGAVVASTMNAAGAGTITLNGTGGDGLSMNEGLRLVGSQTRITSAFGNILITGRGGNGPSVGNNWGIRLGGPEIVSTGPATITLNGTGGSGSTSNVGIRSTGTIRSSVGDITLIGQGGPTATSNFNDGIVHDTIIESTGTAKITLIGTGGSGTDSNRGVRIEGEIKSMNGEISITGTGGPGTASGNSGVEINGPASKITSENGNISIVGTGSTGTSQATGVEIRTDAHVVSTGSAIISITGIGGGTSTANEGVALSGGAVVSSNRAKIQITGTAGPNSFAGIDVRGAGTTIDTASGSADIELIADSIEIAIPTITAGSGTVILRPKTAGRHIDLNALNALGVLSLTDFELDAIIAATLQIGDASSGPVTITADISRPAPTNVSLTSGSSINFTTGSLNTAGGNLTLTPGASSSVGVANDANDAVLSPTGTLTFAPGSDLAITINGLAVDTQYHQLNVAGIVDLTGVDLILSGSFAPSGGNSFTIVNNDGAEPITSVFTGLPEGHVFTATLGLLPATLQITYQGGDGNDVVLTAVDPANPTFIGSSADDNWDVERNGENLDVRLNSVLILSAPFSSLASLSFSGLAGNDMLTVKQFIADAIPDGGIVFDGGSETSALGDTLRLEGNDFGDVTYNYVDAHGGSIESSNLGTVTYAGLEQHFNAGESSNFVVNLPATPNSISLGPAGLEGTTIPTTGFSSPSGSLTINRGTPADSITLEQRTFGCNLIIGSSASPMSSVTFNGSVGLSINKSLSVHSSGPITFPNAASGVGASGTGGISLTTSRNISFSAGAGIGVVDGDLTLSANQQVIQTPGDFAGIRLDNAGLTSFGAGNIRLDGRAGDDPSTDLHIGVHIIDSQVFSRDSGSIVINGVGGAGTTDNDGVVIEQPLALVRSNGPGDVTITGAGGSGSTTLNRGVAVINGGEVTSVGPAGFAGKISILGTGGAGTDRNYGVEIFGTDSLVISDYGDITINGQASLLATGSSNYGVYIASDAFVRSNGHNESAANISIVGTGGGSGTQGANTNQGVRIDGADTTLWSHDGDISITGTGGLSTSPSNTFADGVRVVNSSQIKIWNDGLLTLTGTPGTTDASLGVAIRFAGRIFPIGPSIEFIGDSMFVDPAASIRTGLATTPVILRPKSPGVQIDVGAATDAIANTLALSDVELDQTEPRIIEIGDANSGSITLTADISRAMITNVSLISGGDIRFDSGSIDTAGGDLTLAPGSLGAASFAKMGLDVIAGATGTLSFALGSDLAIAINGTAVDSEYEQLNVTGLVNLTGVDLVLSGTYTPATEDIIVIVSNDGADPVIGTFNGLDNGEIFTIDAGPLQGNYQIVYDGGDGNDVVVTAINAAPAFVPALDEIAVNDETGPFSVPFATTITAGPPRESGQQLEFKILSNTNESLFAVLPSIDAAGILTFTPQFNVAGQATITVALQDNGGTAGGGSDTSVQESFTIDVAKLRVWYNAKKNRDVTGDGFIVSEDALEIINLLNAFGPTDVPTDGRPTPPYYDCDGDGIATAGDALEVINFLNAFGGEEAGEGEPPPPSPLPDPLATSHQRRVVRGSPDPAHPTSSLPIDLLTLLATDLATQPRRRK